MQGILPTMPRQGVNESVVLSVCRTDESLSERHSRVSTRTLHTVQTLHFPQFLPRVWSSLWQLSRHPLRVHQTSLPGEHCSATACPRSLSWIRLPYLRHAGRRLSTYPYPRLQCRRQFLLDAHLVYSTKL